MNKIPNQKDETQKSDKKKDESAMKEQAINKRETDGRDINHQVKISAKSINRETRII